MVRQATHVFFALLVVWGATAFPAKTAASPLKQFVICSARYDAFSALAETDPVIATQIALRKSHMHALVEAVEPSALQAQPALGWYRQSRSALLDLLSIRLHTFSLRHAQQADRRINALLAECDSLLL